MQTSRQTGRQKYNICNIHHMLKLKTNLEKCHKCQKKKDNLKLIMYYGKKAFLCNDCKNLKSSKYGLMESYWLPSNKIH